MGIEDALRDSLSVWADVTEYHSLLDLKQEIYFSQFEVWEFELRVPA